MELKNNRRIAGGVLEPIALDLFFEQYWEQKPLHIERSSINPFSELISIEAIERLLSTSKLSTQQVQLSHAGKRIAFSDYADESGQIVPSRIVESYKTGSTIILSQAQQLVPELMGLCRDVQASLMMRCQTNLYLSPAGNQGFNPHYDTHDVFILQVSGSKKFNFYSERTSHPTSADRFDKDIHAVGDKTETIELSAGDTLYIPRGVVHDAVADIATPSLHITLGVYPVLLHTLLEDVLQAAVSTDSRLRRAISQAMWMSGQSIEDTIQLLREVLDANIKEESITSALHRLRDDCAVSAVKDVVGTLTQPQQSNSQSSDVLDMCDATEISVNHEAILHVERSTDSVVLRTFGQVLEFPEPLGSTLEWLIMQKSFRLSEMSGLHADQRSALVQTLLSVDILELH